MADFTSATLLRATGWQRWLGGGKGGWMGSVEKGEEEGGGGVSGGHDWTLAHPPPSTVVALSEWRQCCHLCCKIVHLHQLEARD